MMALEMNQDDFCRHRRFIHKFNASRLSRFHESTARAYAIRVGTIIPQMNETLALSLTIAI
jgi:hypothetical protein